MELFIGILIAGLIGAAIGQARARTGAGFFLGCILGPIGWLILILGPNPKKEKEEATRLEAEYHMQKMQREHLKELRALREAVTKNGQTTLRNEEDLFWVRLKDRDAGPIGKVELLELYSSEKITLNTQVARDDESKERIYRSLSEEVPALKKLS